MNCSHRYVQILHYTYYCLSEWRENLSKRKKTEQKRHLKETIPPFANKKSEQYGGPPDKTAASKGEGNAAWKRTTYSNGKATTYETKSSSLTRAPDNRMSHHNTTRIEKFASAQTGYNNVSQDDIPMPAVPRIVDEFWKDLDRRSKMHSGKRVEIDVYNESKRNLWIETWEYVASGAKGNLSVLVKPLLQLPRLNIALPTHDIVLRVLIRLVNADDANLEDLENTVNVVRNRLIESVRYIKYPTCHVEDAKYLENCWKNSLRSLRNQNDVNFSLFGHIMSRASDFEQYMNLLSIEDGVNEAGEKSTWLGWRDNPTVDWLLSGPWLQGPKLSKSYENTEDYAGSLLKIWPLLTFYWGAGALWPKCVTRGNNRDKVCGEPMLCPATTGSCSQCKINGSFCSDIAVWRCHRHNHDSICKRCLLRVQSNICGQPGLQASTDIYDGQVYRETVRRDGLVTLLSNLTSRKPPNIAPNWKTSYRLKVSGLVGIIRLKSYGEPLSRNQSIQCGEIVQYNTNSKFDDDWRYRTHGQMAVRLIGRSDCSSFPASADSSLEINGRVAIVDMRVFVPEVMSVLSIFAQRSFNDILSQIPFIDVIIGRRIAPGKVLCDTSSAITLIKEAVQTSNICVLRLASDYVKDIIVSKIFHMRQFQSLYGTQLEAFAMGLNQAVHCTQGPPGNLRKNIYFWCPLQQYAHPIYIHM